MEYSKLNGGCQVAIALILLLVRSLLLSSLRTIGCISAVLEMVVKLLVESDACVDAKRRAYRGHTWSKHRGVDFYEYVTVVTLGVVSFLLEPRFAA